MYTNPQIRTSPAVQDLRRGAGRWLRDLRERRGLSQRQLADLVGVEYYTFVSQLETGRGRIPPDRYRDWARALDVPAREFVHTLMQYYDPVTFEILFGPEDEAAPDNGSARR
jgi:transcriptional regulator with XRE-family HTH domain